MPRSHAPAAPTAVSLLPATSTLVAIGVLGLVMALSGCGEPPQTPPTSPPTAGNGGVPGSDAPSAGLPPGGPPTDGLPSGAYAPPGTGVPTGYPPPGGQPTYGVPTYGGATYGQPTYVPPPTVAPTTPAVRPAPKCSSGPTTAQVLAVVRDRPDVSDDERLVVRGGPYCAGDWQFTTVGPAKIKDADPLFVITRGRPAALRVIEAGGDVCSDLVETGAPPGIRVLACGA